MSYSFFFRRITRQQIITLLVVLVFFIGTFLNVYANPNATAYLSSAPHNPWVTLGLVSSGKTVDVSYLKSTAGNTAIEYAAPILALTSAGKNPRTYPDTDLVEILLSYASNEQLGDPATLNDDIFGILALLASGLPASHTVVENAQTFILNNQNPDGGWGFATGGTSDTNMTGAAIMALRALGIPSSDTTLVNARTYLVSAQNSDGGFPYDPKSSFGTDSDSSSDAWVILAIYALGEDPLVWTQGGQSPIDHLLSLQTSNGYFEHQPGGGENSFTPISTAYAVLALNQSPLPFSVQNVSMPTVTYRIEGSESTLCLGHITTKTALMLVEDVAEICGFTPIIEETSFGPYLKQIGADTAEGVTGWMYRVNGDSPSVGAADYLLNDHDDVLWYFAPFDTGILRMTLPTAHIASGGSVLATVESYEGGIWDPLGEAVVHYGNSTAQTNDKGTVEFTPPDGMHTVHAEKNGYVRSATQTIVVGDLPRESVQLKVTVQGVQQNQGNRGEDSAIAFSIDVNTLDFGVLAPGTVGTQSLTITNTGDVPISLASTIDGESIFTNYLLLDKKAWPLFRKLISIEETRSVSLSLPIPPSFSRIGSQSGTLIFWASQADN